MPPKILYDANGYPITPGAYTGEGPKVSLPWLLLYKEETPPHGRPLFFLGHGSNFNKYELRKDITIVGRIPDKEKAIKICKEMNDRIPGRKAERQQYRRMANDNAARAEALKRLQEEFPTLNPDSEEP